MANQLKVAKVFSIEGLHAQGWSHRRIARELGVHRETVARYLRKAPKPAKAPTGSDAEQLGKEKAKNSANQAREN